MIEKPKRPKQPSIQERQPPRTLQELTNRYDLDNTKVYDYLDYMVTNINNDINISTEVMDTKKRIVFTPLVGDSQASFGGCYYYKKGTRVHLHVGCNSLTSNALNNVFTMPEGYRPDSYLIAIGGVSGLNDICFLQVASNGLVSIKPINGTVALADIEYDAIQ